MDQELITIGWLLFIIGMTFGYAYIFDRLIDKNSALHNEIRRLTGGGVVVMPKSLSEPDTIEIADKAAEYLDDSMNLDSADICAIHLAIAWAVQDLNANTTKG